MCWWTGSLLQPCRSLTLIEWPATEQLCLAQGCIYIWFTLLGGGGVSIYKYTDFVLQPPKSGLNRLEQVQAHCFSREAHGATLGLIFFGFWSPKSDKPWKVLRDCLTNFPTGGPSGKQTDYPWDLSRANFSRQPLLSFHCLYPSLIGCIIALADFRGSSFINQLQTKPLKPSMAIKYSKSPKYANGPVAHNSD